MNKEPQPSASLPFDDLRRVVRLMKDNDLSVFQYEKDGLRIKLRRGAEPVILAAPAAAPMAAATAPAAAAAPAATAGAVPIPQQAEGEDVSSPMVGTFYRSASPNDPPFVSVGDTVQKGQTLCIIEAMKVMNEIKAERGGVVTAVLAEDGNPVQFGQALLRLK